MVRCRRHRIVAARRAPLLDVADYGQAADSLKGHVRLAAPRPALQGIGGVETNARIEIGPAGGAVWGLSAYDRPMLGS